MAFINPQFPYSRSHPLMRTPEPTELMSLENYKTQGRIAGILQNEQFLRFSMNSLHARFSAQSSYIIGSGIQTGQYVRQHLTDRVWG